MRINFKRSDMLKFRRIKHDKRKLISSLASGNYIKFSYQWVVGFHDKSAGLWHTLVELEALKEGLRMAIYHNLDPQKIESNFVEIIKLLQRPTFLYTNILNSCRLRLKSLWNPVVWRSFCQAYGVADSLSILSSHLSRTNANDFLLTPLDIVEAQLKKDWDGVLCSTVVSWSFYNQLVCLGNQSVMCIYVSNIVMSDSHMSPRISSVLLRFGYCCTSAAVPCKPP